MARVKVPVLEDEGPYDPPADELIARLDANGGVMRFGELVESDSLPVRQTLDSLTIEGVIERFPVGNRIIIRLLEDDPDGVGLR